MGSVATVYRDVLTLLCYGSLIAHSSGFHCFFLKSRKLTTFVVCVCGVHFDVCF